MEHTFLIAEAGSNWAIAPEAVARGFPTGLDAAKRLIEVAANAGCDACKFQAFSPGGVYVKDAGSYGDIGDVNALFDGLVMPRAWLPDLAAECERRGIEFMASVFSPEDADAVDPFVKRHKIASYELGHEALIRHVAAKGKPVVLSTGAATTFEVQVAINWARESLVNDLTILHCVAAYPAPLEQLHLRVISEDLLACMEASSSARSKPLKAGLSDHTTDPVIAPVMAVALGASVIEKHFTFSRTLQGPDHRFALTPSELRQMVVAVRTAESALGGDAKEVQPCEADLRAFATRACQATRHIAPGEAVVTEGPEANVAALRPGSRRRGMDARYLTSLAGRKLRIVVLAGDGVREEDLA